MLNTAGFLLLAHPFLLGVPASLELSGVLKTFSLPQALSPSFSPSFLSWLPRALGFEQIKFSKWLLQAPAGDRERMSHIWSSSQAGVSGSWRAAGVVTAQAVVAVGAPQARACLKSLTPEGPGARTLGSTKRQWVSPKCPTWQVSLQELALRKARRNRLGGWRKTLSSFLGFLSPSLFWSFVC